MTLALSESDARNRPKPHEFFPSRINPLVTWICKRTAFFNIRRKLKVTEVDISDEDMAVLRRLRKSRCLLMPSHSGGFEPYLVVYLSKLLRTDFHYLAAIEAFQRNRVIGWIMQRNGGLLRAPHLGPAQSVDSRGGPH
jgi:hypothetical protein